jgi:hypothetical protein
MKRNQSGAMLSRLLLAAAVGALSACVVEPAPPSGGYAWYEGPYYPWYYPEYYYWPGVTVEAWSRYRGWHGGWHGHGVAHEGVHRGAPPGGGRSHGHRSAVPHTEKA